MYDHTSDVEVDGSFVHIVLADEGVFETERRILGLTTRDDLEFELDEDDEDVDITTQYINPRYRVSATADLECSSLMHVDLEAAEAVGIVKEDGELTTSDEDRSLEADDGQYLEIAFHDEPAAPFHEANLISRFGDVELTNVELDMSETPPVLSWTWWIEGDMILDYTPVADLEPLRLEDGTAHTIESETTETYDGIEWHDGGELTLENDAELEITEYPYA